MKSKTQQYLSENDIREKKFPVELFDKSCLIYTKNDYGIFLVTGTNGQNYTMKVSVYLNQYAEEILVALYVKKKLQNMPNLLLPEEIYIGQPPPHYPLFRDEKNRLKLRECKDVNLKNIFNEFHFSYSYYVTKACLYNLGYYLGVHKGTLTYKGFVAFSFQILAALQSLHSIGVWHRDVKPQNILICNSDLAKNYSGVTYTINSGGIWTTSYKDTEGRDMKIIDYGESFVEQDIKNPCISFEYEVTVAAVSIFNTMWSKVVGKENKGIFFEQLVSLLKNCKTSVLDVLIRADIYNELKYEDTNSYKVILL